jgi:hypothetical protein
VDAGNNKGKEERFGIPLLTSFFMMIHLLHRVSQHSRSSHPLDRSLVVVFLRRPDSLKRSVARRGTAVKEEGADDGEFSKEIIIIITLLL